MLTQFCWFCRNFYILRDRYLKFLYFCDAENDSEVKIINFTFRATIYEFVFL